MTVARRLADLWWIRLPLASRRGSVVVASALTDGYAVVSFPWLAAVLSPIAVITGFVVGRDSMGYDGLLTESLALMLLFVAIGTISAHYGLLFTLGFVIGDFFFHFHEWENPRPYLFASDGFWDHTISFRVPLLVVYLALGFVTVVLPLAAKSLTAQFAIGPKPMRFIVAMAVHAAISGGFAYLWSQSIPVIVRPVFTWSSGNPPLPPIEPAQTNGTAFVLVAVACSLARLLIQVIAASSTITRVRQDLWADAIQSAPPMGSFYLRAPALVRSVVSAALVTLMMAGLFLTWSEAWVIAGIALALALSRTGALPLPIDAFRRLMARIPLLLRIAVGMAIVYYVARNEIGEQPSSPDFEPSIRVVAIALIVFFVLNPGSPKERR